MSESHQGLGGERDQEVLTLASFGLGAWSGSVRPAVLFVVPERDAVTGRACVGAVSEGTAFPR